jgi:hypothetical protein
MTPTLDELQGRLVRIAPIKKEYTNNNFFEGSLAQQGYTRLPGTTVAVCPTMDISGKYLTGLDENARSLEALRKLDKEEYEKEVTRIKLLKTHLEEVTGYDLGPRSVYYKKVSENRGVQLGDDEVVLNLDKPEDMITFLWIKNNQYVAPSFEAWTLGGPDITPDMEFYIKDEGEEVKAQYKIKQDINKAISKLDTTPEALRLKWAKLLGLRINDLSSAEDIYNKLDTYIKDTKTSLKEFTRVTTLTKDLIDVKVTIKDAYTYNVIRSAPGGAIMFGNDKVSGTTAELEDLLLDSKNSEMLVNLKSSIKDKKKQALIKS